MYLPEKFLFFWPTLNLLSIFKVFTMEFKKVSSVIPLSFFLFGGYTIFQLNESKVEINNTENAIRHIINERKSYIQSDRNPVVRRRIQVLAGYQPDARPIMYKNMYPKGNPPYKNFFAKKHQPLTDLNLDDDSTMDLAQDNLGPLTDRKLPDYLRNDLHKRNRVKQQILKNYQAISKDVEISKRIIQREINQGSRTEAEIKEALEALEKKKEAQEMLMEDMQVIQQAENNELQNDEGDDIENDDLDIDN